MSHRKSVALLIETSNAYARELLEGVITWVRQHDGWSVYLPEQTRGADPPTWLSRWNGDGIIARIETEAIANVVRQTKTPVVDVSAARHVPDIPWVETNDASIVKLAVDHLKERGFRTFGFYGDPGFQWSVLRKNHFLELMRENGHEHLLHESVAMYDQNYSWNKEKRRLAKWLEQLPRPIGIMACYDVKAQQLLDVCRELDIAVPEEIAVVGVDNDHLLCELSTPPLSSVIPNAHQTGYEAARLLERMMQGETIPPEPYLIEPIGLKIRQSSDVLAIDDPDVANAVRYIREHAFEQINVADVLKVVPLSRRILENRFRKILGRTPHQEILRMKIDRVKRLLTETDRPLAEIARMVGIEHDEYLSVAFKREVGVAPSVYRRSQSKKERF